MKMTRAVPALLVTALFSAACGGGGSGTKQAGGPTVPAPAVGGAPTTVVAGTDPVVTAKAQAAGLQPNDFPAGWKPTPPEDGGGLNLDTVWTELTKCLGVTTAAPAGTFTSPTFLRGLATQARSTVEYTSEASSAAISSALAGPKFQGCANEAFTADVKRSAPQGGVPGPVTIAPLDVAAVAPAKTTTYRINVTISLDELKVPLFQDFMVIFNRGAVIRLFFLNPGSEFPRDLQRTLIDKVVSRV